jgi:TonB family protein
MVRYAMVVFFSIVFIMAEEKVKTKDNLEIILKDDSTWVMVDSTAELKSSVVTTQDSQTVLLRNDGTWEYMSKEGVLRDTVSELIPLPDSLEDAHPEIPPSKEPFPEIVPYYLADVKPVPISMPTPRYQEKARREGIQGTTVVQMLIDVTGYVCDVKIIKSSGNKLLDKAAYDAAMKSTFTPAEMYGRKVRVWVARPIKFQLTH